MPHYFMSEKVHMGRTSTVASIEALNNKIRMNGRSGLLLLVSNFIFFKNVMCLH